jgi:DNA-binding NarL/FixJ family response regulator
MVNNAGLDKPISILVLDESGMMRTSLRTLLTAIPYVQLCRTANLADVSWELIEELHPDCLLMVCTAASRDLRLLELIASLKKARPEMRCLVITISSERNREYLAAGADLGLVNGFTLNDLCQALDQLFKLRADQELSSPTQ